MKSIKYFTLGSIFAIAIARSYVYVLGSLSWSFDGYVIHHLYYGVGLIILSLILLLLSDLLDLDMEFLISFMFGFSLGLIVDEINMFLFIGSPYTMQMYNSLFAVQTDILFIVVLLVIGHFDDHTNADYVGEREIT